MPTKDPVKKAAKQKRYLERLLAALVDDYNHPQHGRLAAYNAGCRCHRCQVVRAEYQRKRIENRKSADSSTEEGSR